MPYSLDGAQTTLAAPLSAAALTGEVASAAGFPVTPFHALISAEGANESELVLVTDVAGTTVTLARNFEAPGWAPGGTGHAFGASFVVAREAERPATTPRGGSVTVSGTGGGSVSGVTSLQVAGVVAESSPGVAVQGLVANVIGPFDFAFDTPGLVYPSGLLVANLAAETEIVAVYLYVLADFTTGDNADQWQIDTGISDSEPYGDSQVAALGCVVYDKGATGHSNPPKLRAVTDTDISACPRVVWSAHYHIGEPLALTVTAYANEGTNPLTAGTARLYAIIATPAS